MGLSWFTTTNGAAFWSLLFPPSPPSDQKCPRPNGPFNRCHSFAISFLSIQVKNKLHCAIFPPTLVGIRSFIRNRCIFVKIWGLKLLKCMSGGGGRAHTFLLEKFGKFVIRYLDEFAADSYETSYIYQIGHDKLISVRRWILSKKTKKQ